MAPRKKKTQQKTANNANTTTKTKTAAKRPTKKKAPVKKVTTRKPRQPKKLTIESNYIESSVENIKDTDGEELPYNLEETLVESNDGSSVESKSISSQCAETEYSTCDTTEQFQHLEMQEQDLIEEIIEFDAVDNVITVEYISEEVTLGVENENSNLGDIQGETSNDEIMKEEKMKSEDADEVTRDEQNICDMMNKFEISQVSNSLQEESRECEELNPTLGENVQLNLINEIIESDNQSSKNDMVSEEVEVNKPENVTPQLEELKNENENLSIVNEENKTEKLPKGKNKKQNEAKSSKGQKKEKTKIIKPKSAQKSKTDELDDSSIRRSSRIKSISVLKKPSVGHGLVKVKDCEISDVKNENEKSTSVQCTPNKNESTEKPSKPIKVKSRWRRSSELEMNSEITSSGNMKQNQNTTNDSEKDGTNSPVKDELVESRLKQFVHLKENVYLTERFICKEAKKMTCDCFLTEEEKTRGEMACGEDCLNRLLMIECGNLCQVGDRCANKKFQKTQFAPVEVFNTHKKGLGLRAAANIPYGEFILEYVGEVLNADEFDRRADVYSQDKNTHYYFMSLRSDAIIDATQKGNISRFINHSCEPNAETQKWTVNGELRIGFFSTRTILAGEEVTFDYRFERYGKEAQKCFCEAPSCRGWLGEEPDEDEEGEEDDDEEEEEVEETSEVKPAPEIVEIKVEESSSEEVAPKIEKEEIASVPIPVVTKVKKTKTKRKLRKELFEDDQLDEEIDVLVTTGLKNQAHTLKLSRLMLRAKEPAQRAKLLRVLRRGELPCRRLFLDYHGLRLMHGYMTDAQHLCQMEKKYDSLRLEVLQTLAVLPVPNKTMLQDSKVLPTIEKWSVPLTSGCSLDSNSESNSPKVDTEVSQSPTPLSAIVETSQENAETDNSCVDQMLVEQIRKSVGMEEVKTEYSYFKNTRGSALAEEIVNIFEDEMYLSSPKTKPVPMEVKQPMQNYEFEIIILATKLVEMWSKLKEVFRIPKKERIEQMKEHEREANKGYIAGLGLEQYAEKKNESRYNRGMQRSRQQDKKNFKPDERNQQQTLLSKHNRRKLFALQVEHQEEERRRKQRELWIQHEKNCMLIGTDPRFTAPFDPTRGFQCIWNPQIGQWQNYPIPPSAENPLGYGHMPSIAIPTSLPNTNIPPPNLQPTSSYPYGMPQMPMSAPLPPISTSRSLSHMIPPIPVVRPPMPSSIPPPIMHQMLPTSGSIATNIHQSQAIPGLPPLSTNLPPPTMPPQTPPPLPGAQGLHNPMGYSPQMLIGQTQSPVLYQQEKKSEIISFIGDVKFLGPIPPPPKLPPKWKSAKDKYGRPYYYHIRIRKSQWEPPSLEPPESTPEEDSESSSSDSSSSTSDSSSDDSDSDDEIINDSRLLRQVKKQINKEFKVSTPIKALIHKPSRMEDTPSPVIDTSEIQSEVLCSPLEEAEEESSIDKRLKEQFNLLDEEGPSAKRKKNSSLVQEIIISPRTEEDRLLFKEDIKRYKENKLMLKKQKEIILQQRKKHLKEKKLKQQPSKAKIREMKYSTTENSKKIKESFRSAMANTVVAALNAYRKSDCKEGRITNTEDFKHLARKLTHFVMLKEMKHISEIEELVCSDSVKVKAKDFIRKYMSKFGEMYVKRDDEPEHYY